MVKWYSQLKGLCVRPWRQSRAAASQASIIPHDQHQLSLEQLSRNALRVIDRLVKAGFETYLVGGSIRDLILSQQPKDFDVVTAATPEQVKDLFKNSRIIGRRFKLVHVVYGREVIEVATFRRTVRQPFLKSKLRGSHFIPRDNEFGTCAQDAMRRDFNVNALYYDIRDSSIVDYSDGMSDLQRGRFCMIGEPERRYREDPVRLLRALRLMSKSNLQPTLETEKPMKKLVPLLSTVSPARLFDEINKAFLQGYAQKNFAYLEQYAMIEYLFPTLPKALSQPQYNGLIACALRQTDQRFHQGKSLNPAFLLSVFLWSAFQDKLRDLRKEGVKPYAAKQMAAAAVLKAQVKKLTMPRRHTQVIKEIWMFQYLLEQRRSRQVNFVFAQKRFRAAYDFLCMRAEIDASLAKQAEWWTAYQEADEDQRASMVQSVHKNPNS